MDISSGDVAVRHLVAFKSLNLQHTFDCSPSVVSLVREVKHCIYGIAGVWAAVAAFRSWLDYRRATDQQRDNSENLVRHKMSVN